MAYPDVSRWVQLSSGAASGLLCDVCMHPLDTVRTRLMVERHSGKARFRGVFHCFYQTARYEGPKALYKGLGAGTWFDDVKGTKSAVLTLSVPAHALYFGAYEVLKRTLGPGQTIGQKGPLTHFAAGIGADMVGSMCWVPMDILKQRMMIQRAGEPIRYHSYRHAITKIYASEGIRGFYRGFWASIGTFGPAAGVYFMTFEQLRRLYSRAAGKSIENVDELPWAVNLTCGVLGGSVAASLTTPIDMIKTRLMVQDASEVGAYRSFANAVVRILREEGLRPFYYGTSARVLWMAPGYGLTISTYHWFKRVFQSLERERFID